MASASQSDQSGGDAPFSLDVERTDEYLRRMNKEIEREKARTESRLALVLVWALVLSLPAYYMATYFMPGSSEHLAAAMDKWFAVMGPLAGAAVGVGYLRQSQGGGRSQ